MSQERKIKTFDLFEMMDERINRIEEAVNRLSQSFYARLNELAEEIDYIGRRTKRMEGRIKHLRSVTFEERESIPEHEEVLEEIEFHRIPMKDAKTLILEYVHNHPGSTTSDIFLGLNLDPELVSKALIDLGKEKKLRGVPLE